MKIEINNSKTQFDDMYEEYIVEIGYRYVDVANEENLHGLFNVVNSIEKYTPKPINERMN